MDDVTGIIIMAFGIGYLGMLLPAGLILSLEFDFISKLKYKWLKVIMWICYPIVIGLWLIYVIFNLFKEVYNDL